MTTSTLLKVLLRQRHWQNYATFCREYDKAAHRLDSELVGTWPSRAQLHRWVSGELARLPYPDHCRILEEMFPDSSAEQLFAPCVPGGSVVPPAWGERPTGTTGHLAGVRAVYVSRSQLLAQLPPQQLLDGARQLHAAGLSLNVLCQQYPDRQLAEKIEDGLTARCLFLDPVGEAIRRREAEEGYTAGTLSVLTELNIRILLRLRDRLDQEARHRLAVATYDETLRFNLLLIDGARGVIQPYLPDARGVEAPAFYVEQEDAEFGLLAVFSGVFASLWSKGKPL